jgi:hypothetical protein
MNKTKAKVIRNHDYLVVSMLARQFRSCCHPRLLYVLSSGISIISFSFFLRINGIYVSSKQSLEKSIPRGTGYRLLLVYLGPSDVLQDRIFLFRTQPHATAAPP